MALSRKALMMCDARWRAGTLFTLTPEEDDFFAAVSMQVICFCAGAYLNRAADVLFWWPQFTDDEDEKKCVLRAVHGAMQAALEIDRRGFMQWRDPSTGLMPHPRTPEQASHISSAIFLIRGTYRLLNYALSTSAGGALWQRLRVTCAIPAAEEAALLQLAVRSPAELQAAMANTNSEDARGIILNNVWREQQQRAAADMARHGLRACALPECDSVEPQPKTFKVCGRCRAVVYCSAAHQHADWRRHKRADGCKAAA
jgi:hypothetical protein